MKRIVCPKCGSSIEKESTYCEHCGYKIQQKEGILKESEVRKNIFGLLAMYTFLFTVCVLTLIPMALSVFDISISWLTTLSYIGYSLSIIFAVTGIIVCKKNRTIDMQAAGMNYGSAAMVFSIFMLVAKLARMY